MVEGRGFREVWGEERLLGLFSGIFDPRGRRGEQRETTESSEGGWGIRRRRGLGAGLRVREERWETRGEAIRGSQGGSSDLQGHRRTTEGAVMAGLGLGNKGPGD